MRKRLLTALLFTGLTLSQADAKVPAINNGSGIIFDPDFIPNSFRSSYLTMNSKCVKCHSMERIVASVQTGRAQVTGQPFDKQNVKAHGIKLLHNPNSDMSRHEIREIVALLCFLIEENKK